MSRVSVPPAEAIVRQTKLDFFEPNLFFTHFFSLVDSHNSEAFQKLIVSIRTALLFNLGLSKPVRDEEAKNPLCIIDGTPSDFPSEEICALPGNSDYVIFENQNADSNIGHFSIRFSSRFRQYTLHIDPEGNVKTSLKLKWSEIYRDLAPLNAEEKQPLLAFTPWQRHSECNFFNGRSSNKILSLLSKQFSTSMEFNARAYYRDDSLDSLNVSVANNQLISGKTNLYLVLDESVVTPATNFSADKRQPVLAIISRHTSLMGDLIMLAPGIYDSVSKKLHLLIQGHAQTTEVLKIVSCDFESKSLNEWSLLQSIKVSADSKTSSPTPEFKSLDILREEMKDEVDKFSPHLSAAPMVRGSDPAARQFWLNTYFTGVVYTEMVTIANILSAKNDVKDPLVALQDQLYSPEGEAGFARLRFTINEFEKAKSVVFQMVTPHLMPNQNDPAYFWGKDGEHIGRTVAVGLQLIMAMVPEKFHAKIRLGINMCCPAPAVENVGAGFGLRKYPGYREEIVRAIQDLNMPVKPLVEFKSLMESGVDNRIAVDENIKLAASVFQVGASFAIQGKPRNKEYYDVGAVAEVHHGVSIDKPLFFMYSGMVATLNKDGLRKLNYEEGSPHYSVEGVLDQLDRNKSHVEVMLGRVLLGSSWLLTGRYNSDSEILLYAIRHASLLQEATIGMGEFGLDLYQIHTLYHIRHMTNESIRDALMVKIQNTTASEQIIPVLYAAYKSMIALNQHKPRHIGLLKDANHAALPQHGKIISDKLKLFGELIQRRIDFEDRPSRKERVQSASEDSIGSCFLGEFSRGELINRPS